MNTIRNVMIVVVVLMTSCQVSEKSKSGPVTAHTTIINPATRNAVELPVAFVILVEILSKLLRKECFCFFIADQFITAPLYVLAGITDLPYQRRITKQYKGPYSNTCLAFSTNRFLEVMDRYILYLLQGLL
jgi:hypothetical protein